MPPTEISLIDVKYTTMDRFASFGGNYGIFAEITGCSLLGLLSIVILTYKLLLNKVKIFFRSNLLPNNAGINENTNEIINVETETGININPEANAPETGKIFF